TSRPGSSAGGILQRTDGAYAEARRYCIHDHAVVREGRWYDRDACWFNVVYSRPIPSHSIEMTSARLHQLVVDILQRERLARATVEQRQRLAAVIHLCGAERGAAFARRGFRVARDERCGDHALGAYLAQVHRLRAVIARLDAT